MSTFQVAYKILETDLLRQTDRERAASIAVLVSTDEDAKKLAGHDGFGWKLIDTIFGRAGVITYKGAELVLLFKRRIHEIGIGPSDPVPEFEIKDPQDAWVRINLLDPKVPYFARTELNKAQAENSRLRLLLKSANIDLGSAQDVANTARAQREEVSRLNTRIKNLEESLKASTKDVESLDQKLRNIRSEFEARFGTTALEILPSYDTVRMALEVDPANKLMSSLRGQLKSMLMAFGCSVIEPIQWTLFDPEVHHAVHGYQFSQGDPRIGQIVKVVTVGLKKGGSILKAANVAVGIEKKDDGGSNGAANG